MFFFLAASVPDSYSVSALENDRKKWLPPGRGRSWLLPALPRGGFCSKATAASALPGAQEGGCRVWILPPAYSGPGQLWSPLTEKFKELQAL